ncbi:unnamed protein product [Cylicostephanus goldi]|uniref:Uncharacterized protein n=1 Tax=Cylicostephanus goldi TaxID=71465 RepID=A0A3P6RRH0_CYLGO|nr:unnamed protein product [Cylicostephanus goldi]
MAISVMEHIAYWMLKRYRVRRSRRAGADADVHDTAFDKPCISYAFGRAVRALQFTTSP